MKRKTKNIITSSIVIILIGITLLTIYLAQNSIKNSIPTMDFNNPMQNNNSKDFSNDMNNNQEENKIEESKEKSNNNMNNTNEQKGIPNGEEPSTKPEEKGEKPPTKPDDNNQFDKQNEGNQGNPPAKPDDNNMMQGGMMPPNGINIPMMNDNTNNKINIWYIIAFIIEGLTLSGTITLWILTNFHEKTIKEIFKNKDKLLILLFATLAFSPGIAYLNTWISKNIANNNQSIIDNQSSKDVSATKTVTTKESLNETYTSTKSDESVILVTKEGNAKIKNATINKESGDTTNTENSDFYGVNAAVLVQSNSEATIKKSTIKTSAKGANAVFATGSNAKIYISNTKIETTGSSSSRGLDATYGGYIEADKVEITTQGGSCATLATDRGEGTVIAKNSTLETNGSGSPIIYSTGNISIDNTKGIANGSQMVVIEGKNTATITNSTLEASGKGNRGETDQAGIMIYQSMSGDAGEGTGTLNVSNSSLTIQEKSTNYMTAPMFFITNTTGIINIENTKLNYGSNILLSIKATSEWGNSGNNGGNVTLNSKNQSLKGNIEVDNLSTLNLNLQENSNYTGTINKDNTAKEINIKLDKNSTITLTGNSYITSLENEDDTYSNINFNGYTLYINGIAVK